MSEKGFTIYTLPGSILEWVLEGEKVFNSQGESRKVHVYRKKWDYLPSGYESVVFNFFIINHLT